MVDKKILIVDFDEESLASLTRLIDEEGFQSEVARDGLAGYEKFQAGDFDLVILEPMLPKLHGFELCKKINQDPVKKVPIIVVTGIYREPSCRMEALQVYGASAFFTKPWNKEDLRAKILQLLIQNPRASSRSEGQRETTFKNTAATSIAAAGVTPSREAKMNKGIEDIERELRQVVADLAGQTKKKEVREPIRPKPAPKDAPTDEIDAMLQSAVGEIGLGTKKKKPEESKEVAELIAGLRMARTDRTEKAAVTPSAPRATVPPPLRTPAAKPTSHTAPGFSAEPGETAPVAREIKTRLSTFEKPFNNIPQASSRATFETEKKPFRIDQTLMEVDRLAFGPPKAPAEPEPFVAPERPAAVPIVEREKDKKVFFDEYAEQEKKKSPFVLVGGLAVAIIAAGGIFLGLKSKKPAEPAGEMVSSIQPTLPAEFSYRQEEVSPPPAVASPIPKPAAKKQASEPEDRPPAEVITPAQSPITTPLEAASSSQPERAPENPPDATAEKEPEPAASKEASPAPSSEPTPNESQPATEARTIQPGSLVPLDQVDTAPALVKRVEPKYPPLAYNMGIGGTVTVNALISETGDVLRTEILKGIKNGASLERAAETAVRQWKFRPARKSGVNVKVWKPIEITFKVNELSSKE